MKKIKVMPDFTSSGIWNDKTGVMIDYEDLPISKQLANEFENWITFYDDCFEEDFTTFKPGKSKEMNEIGMKLAKKLKEELPNYEISFWEENESGIIKHKNLTGV